jgi:hypothetical protein
MIELTVGALASTARRFFVLAGSGTGHFRETADLRVVSRFVIDALVGVICFLLMGLAALGVDALSHEFLAANIDSGIARVPRMLALALFVMDAFLFVIFCSKITAVALRDLLSINLY